jgi:hypothetical protein
VHAEVSPSQHGRMTGVRRVGSSRAVRVTPAGAEGLTALFGADLAWGSGG